MKAIEPPYQRWYDPNARCNYHARAIGHSIKNCLAFKSMVQFLLNVKWLSFEGMIKTPNVKHNPLLNHNNPRVNGIVEWSKEAIKRKVSVVKISMKSIFKTILDMKFLLS